VSSFKNSRRGAQQIGSVVPSAAANESKPGAWFDGQSRRALATEKVNQMTPASAAPIVSFVAEMLGRYQLRPVKVPGNDSVG
jgi:hypothetical protein